MMSLERMKSLMNKDGKNYSDEQLLKIRTFFYQLAEIEVEEYFRKIRKEEDAKEVQLKERQEP